MKVKKLNFFALVLILSFMVVACRPAENIDDTGMDNRNRRLTTQTRIGDRTGNDDTGLNDGLNNDLNNMNNGLNDNINGGMYDNYNGLNNGMTRPNDNNNNFGNMATRANEIASEINDLPEVDEASVVISDDTALVGCSLRGDTQGTMTNALRQKIRGIVKEHADDIENVSVTTDPDMTDRINNMSNSIFQGNPIEGFADEIRDLIRDITPNTNNNTIR